MPVPESVIDTTTTPLAVHTSIAEVPSLSQYRDDKWGSDDKESMDDATGSMVFYSHLLRSSRTTETNKHQ